MANYALMGALSGGLQGLGQSVDRGFQYKMEETRLNSLRELEERKLGIAEMEAQNQREYRNAALEQQRVENKAAQDARDAAALHQQQVEKMEAGQLRIAETEALKSAAFYAANLTDSQTRLTLAQQEAASKMEEAYLKGGDRLIGNIFPDGMDEFEQELYLKIVDEKYGDVTAAREELAKDPVFGGDKVPEVTWDRMDKLYKGINRVYHRTLGAGKKDLPDLTPAEIQADFSQLSGMPETEPAEPPAEDPAADPAATAEEEGGFGLGMSRFLTGKNSKNYMGPVGSAISAPFRKLGNVGAEHGALGVMGSLAAPGLFTTEGQFYPPAYWGSQPPVMGGPATPDSLGSGVTPSGPRRGAPYRGMEQWQDDAPP